MSFSTLCKVIFSVCLAAWGFSSVAFYEKSDQSAIANGENQRNLLKRLQSCISSLLNPDILLINNF
jgi:hypothetical protein